MKVKAFLAALAVATVSVSGLSPASAAGRSVPYVVELFTSQGCSSCPPANANLIKLRARHDVLLLSFSVTYWDSLGWKDVFGREDYTSRQAEYEGHLGHSGPFTPQIVVNGTHDTVGNDFAAVADLLDKQGLAQGPQIELSQDSVRMAAAAAPASASDVWLVRYDPNVVNVAVRRGENTGRTLPHTNVVHDLRKIGRWTGKPFDMALPPATPGLRTAVLVQGQNGGAILAAATD
jgi:hypothetical protein